MSMRNREPKKIKVTSTKLNGKSYTVAFPHWQKEKAIAYRDRQQSFVDRGELWSVKCLGVWL